MDIGPSVSAPLCPPLARCASILIETPSYTPDSMQYEEVVDRQPPTPYNRLVRIFDGQVRQGGGVDEKLTHTRTRDKLATGEALVFEIRDAGL